jgi:TonB family protein
VDAVSEVLRARTQELDGLERMFGASVGAHAVLIAFIALAPAAWLGGTIEREPENVMTISLGGPEGPRTGMTMLGGKPIQTVATEPPKTIEPIRPPAARQPEMIEPSKNAPKNSNAKTAPKDPKSRTPTKGEQVTPGSSPSDTKVRGLGFGISQGGFGAGSYLDTANFCCPEYLGTMLDLIRRNWDSRQQAAGTTTIRFVIQRNGQLTNVEVEKSSGYATLDLLAQRALLLTRELPPLPAAYTESTLPVHLVFEYRRQ